MPRLSSRIFVIYALLLSTVASASPLSEDRAVWSGEGQFRVKLDGPIRAARCRLTSEPSDTAMGFTLNGKCAAPSGSATISLTIEQSAQGRVAGTLASSVVDDTIQLIGTESATGVALVSREPLEVEGQAMRFQIEVRWVAPGTLTLNEWLTPAGGGNPTQIVWMTLSE